MPGSAGTNIPDSANSSRSFSNESGNPDDSANDSPRPSGGGKNGATGPADGKPKPHVCQVCSRAFTTGGHLQRHQRIHTGVKAFKCPYQGCETRTSRQDNLQQHYRTHLSPTLRRGSGSAARAAVAAAMEAAGIKSASSRAPRKSKSAGANLGTPSSILSGQHGQSPYQTPNSQSGPYASYMYDPQQHPYPSYPLPPPGVNMGQPASGQSSRVPSPVNGHSSGHSSIGSIPPHHQQSYYSAPFSPAYSYPGAMGHQQAPYRFNPGAQVPSPYGQAPHPHHGLYSPGMAQEHGQHPMYSPIPTGFQTHSREGSYGVMTPGYSQNPMGNGYPPRTNTSTPLSQSHEDLRHAADDQRSYGRRSHPSPPRRRSPHPADMIAAGIVDPANMTTGRQGQPQTIQPSYGYQHAMPYSYGHPHPHQQMPQREAAQHRASISSVSEDGSGGGGSDGSAGVKSGFALGATHPIGSFTDERSPAAMKQAWGEEESTKNELDLEKGRTWA
ncbi:zinc-finger protein CreA/MIG, partial [Tremellales sp. Uapishka_1]